MKKPLLWAFLAGSTLIVCIRWFLPSPIGALFAAAVAVGAVILLYRQNKQVKQRDRAGDDLYYLGLLLTLISLIYALVSLFILQDTREDVQARVDELIGNFGIALLSTVAGILGRILLQDSSDERLDSTPAGRRDASNQKVRPKQPLPPTEMREDAASTGFDPTAPGQMAQHEQEARLTAEMREAVTNMMQLRRDLREAADAFAHFTRITLSHADHIKSHTQRLIEDFNQHMSVVAERELSDTAAAWHGVGEAMRTDGERLLSRINETVSGTAGRTEQAWLALAGQAESASVSARKRLDADAEEMERMLKQLGTTNGSLQALANTLDDAQRHISTLAETASSATTTLDANATETLAAQRALAEGAKASQTAVLESFKAAAAALTEAVGKQVAQQTLAWRTAVADFDAAGQAHRDRSEQATAATQRTIDALIASLKKAEEDIASLGRTASDTATAMQSCSANPGKRPARLRKLFSRNP